MNNDIRVHVVKYKNRKNLVMRYVDPLTGRQVSRTARTVRKRDAERLAAKWEAELREGRYQKPSRITWQEFRQRYESEKLAQLSERSLESAGAAFRHLERVLNPKLLESLNFSLKATSLIVTSCYRSRLTLRSSYLRRQRMKGIGLCSISAAKYPVSPSTQNERADTYRSSVNGPALSSKLARTSSARRTICDGLLGRGGRER